MAVERRILSPEEAALWSGFSAKTIYRAIRVGELPARKVRSRWKIAAADLDRWLAPIECAAVEIRLTRSTAPPAAGSLDALRTIEAEAA